MKNKKTVLITGCSTGIGKSSAKLFQKMGWNVAATMRTPSKETELNQLEDVICPKLDVLNPKTGEAAIQETIERFGKIDALVNNAGYGLMGPFEGTTEEQMQDQFETNVFGLFRLTKAILPHFRKNQSGVLVNVASLVGRTAFPFCSMYNSSKWAVEGFSEALSYELAPLNIRVKIIEPGAVLTNFFHQSLKSSRDTSPEEYFKHHDSLMKMMSEKTTGGSSPEQVAKTIYKATLDESLRLRFVVGSDAKGIFFLRRTLPEKLYRAIFSKVVQSN